jgi:hypothetical protein
MKIEERINNVIVTADDLIEFSDEVHALPEEDRNFEGRTFLLVKKYKGNADKAMAVDLRMKAMSAIIKSNELPGWAMPIQPEGYQMVSEPVWQAAAEQPLIFDERDAYFDKEKFLDRILSCAKPEGVA